MVMDTDKSNTSSVMDPTDESIFTAGLDDVTTISKILHELHHAGEHSVLIIEKDGLKLISADERSFQVSAYFSSTTFQRYKFDGENYEQVTFRFILKDFIECLNLLRDDPIAEGDRVQVGDEPGVDLMKTSLYIQYRKKGEPLKLRLENKSNYVINCDLKAFNLQREFSPIMFPNDEDFAVITLDSKRFYEYASGLDLMTSDFVELMMGRGEVPLKLVTRSTVLGEVELEIPNDGEEGVIKKGIVVSDNCWFSFDYKTQYMRPALEALKNSTSIEIRCATTGMLCIRHSMSNYNSSVEFFIQSEARPIEV